MWQACINNLQVMHLSFVSTPPPPPPPGVRATLGDLTNSQIPTNSQPGDGHLTTNCGLRDGQLTNSCTGHLGLQHGLRCRRLGAVIQRYLNVSQPHLDVFQNKSFSRWITFQMLK